MSGSSATSSTRPLMLDTIRQQVGMYSGLVTTAAHLSKVANFLKMIPGASRLLGTIGVPLSAYLLIRSAWSFLDHPSLGGALSLGMSAFGLATAVNLMIGASMFGPFGWAIAGMA